MRRAALPSLSPQSLPREDSLTDFLKDNAVTSLPPIDLINRFRFSDEDKPHLPHSPKLRYPYYLDRGEARVLRMMPRRRLMRLDLSRKKSISPEAVVSVVRSALKPLSKTQVDSLAGKAGAALITELINYTPRRVEQTVTVRSHLRQTNL